MKLSTNLIQGKEKSLLTGPTGYENNYKDSSRHRSDENDNSENCMHFVKVIFYLVVAFMILFIGWTGWIYFTPQFSSSNRPTDTPLDSSDIRRSQFRTILYGLDRRMENADSNGNTAEDVPWPSIPGKSVTISMKSVEDDQRYNVEIRMPTTSGIETDKVIAGKSMRLEAVKNLESTINNQDKDGSDSQTKKVGSKNPDYIRNSSNGQLLVHSRSDHQSTSTISQSDNNRSSDDGTAQPAMKIKRSTWLKFEEVDPDREKCAKSLDPVYKMLDELAIAFLTTDDYNMKVLQFREKFIEYLTRYFWYSVLPRPDQRQNILKVSDHKVQSLLSSLTFLVTNGKYNFVKRSPPTQEMTQQFRIIIQTVVFGFEKCMWQQELARRATSGGRFRDYE